MAGLNRWMIVGGLALLPVLGAMSVSQGQVGQPQSQPLPQGARPAQGAQGAGGATVGDREMVQWLIVDNEGEIAISKLAQQNAESDEVKKFAQMMVKDHTQFIQKLQSAGGAGGRQGGAANQNRQEAQPQEAQPRGREEAARDDREQLGEVAQVEQESRRDAAQPAQPGATRQPGAAAQPGLGRQPGTQPGGAARQGRGGSADIVSIKRELGEKCVQSATKMLREKEGQEFDKAFMGMQCMMHQQMLDTLQVFQQRAQGQELQQLLQQGAEKTEQHLAEAKEIMQGLEGRSGGQPPRQAKRSQEKQQERE